MSFLEIVHAAFELCSVLRVVANAARLAVRVAKRLVGMLKGRGGVARTGHEDGGGEAAEVTDTLDNKKGC